MTSMANEHRHFKLDDVFTNPWIKRLQRMRV